MKYKGQFANSQRRTQIFEVNERNRWLKGKSQIDDYFLKEFHRFLEITTQCVIDNKNMNE